MKKKIFVGPGFSSEQYLWMVPLMYGYAQKNNINEIIFEHEKDFSLIKNTPELNLILKNFKFKVIHKKKIFHILKSGVINIFLILRIFYSLNKKNILSTKLNWTFSQLLHGSWDQIILKKNDDENINFFNKIRIIIFCVYKYDLGKKLFNQNVDTAFLSHSVYFERCNLASLREQNIKVYCQAVTGFYKQKKNEDTSWSDINTELFNSYIKKINFINSYWKKRLIGKGSYQTANYSTVASKNHNVTEKFNLVLLHIFKDSPFNVIDRARIFADYIHWIEETLKIVKDSNEIWYFKVHPSAIKWGEDTKEIFNTLIKKIFKKVQKNIVLITDEYSNLKLISKAQKVVTFHGTAHVEAICFGQKPIVISRSPIRKISDKLYFKPKSIREYRQLLLSVETQKFKLSKSETQIGRTFLYIRENIHSLTIRIKRLEYYRNASIELINKSFKSVTKEMSKKFNVDFFINQGKNLSSNKQTHTLNEP